jgi:hypothetical protein
MLKRGANSVAHQLAKAAVKQINYISSLNGRNSRRCVYDTVVLEQHALFFMI